MRETTRHCPRLALLFAAALSLAACAADETGADAFAQGDLDDSASDSDFVVGASCGTRSGTNCSLIPGGYCHPTGVCTVPCEGYCDGNNTFCVEDGLTHEGICVQKTTVEDDSCPDFPPRGSSVLISRTTEDLEAGATRVTIEFYDPPHKQRLSRHIGDSDAPAAEALVCAPYGGIDSFVLSFGGGGE